MKSVLTLLAVVAMGALASCASTGSDWPMCPAKKADCAACKAKGSACEKCKPAPKCHKTPSACKQ